VITSNLSFGPSHKLSA